MFTWGVDAVLLSWGVDSVLFTWGVDAVLLSWDKVDDECYTLTIICGYLFISWVGLLSSNNYYLLFLQTLYW